MGWVGPRDKAHMGSSLEYAGRLTLGCHICWAQCLCSLLPSLESQAAQAYPPGLEGGLVFHVRPQTTYPGSAWHTGQKQLAPALILGLWL
jgi:hypothetical protein